MAGINIKLGFHNSAKLYGVPPAINGYWISLTFIDPLIFFLLIKFKKLGVICCFVNILINVIINGTVQLNTLTTFSISKIYNSLGDVFISLQISFFLFSLATLPFFLTEFTNEGKNKSIFSTIFSKIPIAILTIGLLIHLIGLGSLFVKFPSLWVAWVHLSMTTCDAILIWSLFKRTKIGFTASIIVFSIFALLQTIFAIGNFMGYKCPFSLSMGVTISLCLLAITALIIDKDYYSFPLPDFLSKIKTKGIRTRA